MSRLFSGLVLVLPALAAGEEWQSHTVGRFGDIEVRVEVKSPSSFGDEDWLAFLFMNSSGADVPLRTFQFRSSRESFTTSGTLLSSGNLASGNSHNVFPYAADGRLKQFIPGEGYRAAGQISDYSTVLLGIPTQKEIVRATFAIDVEIEGENEWVQLQSEPFEFTWEPPDQEDYERMRTRLHAMLAAAPRHNWQEQGYILEALLKTPGVGDTLTFEELKNARTIRQNDVTRDTIVKRMFMEDHREEAIRFFKEELKSAEISTLRDLQWSNAYDPSFLEPLLAVIESGKHGSRDAFRILTMHADSWEGDGTTPQRLSAYVRPFYDTAVAAYEQDPSSINNRTTLHFAIQDMGDARDPAVVPELARWLDNTDRWVDTDHLSSNPFALPPPVRLCDVALEAIMKVRGETFKDLGLPTLYEMIPPFECQFYNHFTTQAPPPPDFEGLNLKDLTTDPAAAARYRDAAIKALKERLASGTQP
jgi:hypothetical protein